MTTQELTSLSQKNQAKYFQIFEFASRFSAIITIILLLVFSAIVVPSFYEPSNLRTVIVQASALGIVVLGQTLVLLVRGIDMSVSSVVAITGVLLVQAGSDGNKTMLTLLVIIGIAILIGFSNTALILWRKVPPFIATFIIFIVANGALLAYTRGQSSGSVQPWLREIGSGTVFGIPIPLIVWALLGGLFIFLLNKTIWGRQVYSVGLNREASRHAGVSVNTIIMSAYLLCAILAVIGGLIYTGYQGYVDQNLGMNVNLNSIAAAIIGGVAFSGGRGGVFGAAVGAILLATLTNVVVVAGLPIYWQLIAQGLVLILAVSINGLREKFSTQRI